MSKYGRPTLVAFNSNSNGFSNSRKLPYPLLQYSRTLSRTFTWRSFVSTSFSERARYKSVGVPKQSRGYYARNSVKIAPRRYDIFSRRKESTGGRFRLEIEGNLMTTEREKVGNYERLIGGNY